MTYRARYRCPGSRGPFYTDISETKAMGWYAKRYGICHYCCRRIGLAPKGSRALYPLEWVLKTHYDGRR